MRTKLLLLFLLGACDESIELVPQSFSDFAIPVAPAPAQDLATVTPPPPVDMAVTVAPLASVTVGDNFFSPMTITVSPGTIVTWTFSGILTHTATSDTAVFDSGLRSTGTFSFGFATGGTFPYHCQVHGAPGAGMFGTVIVQ